MNDAVNTMRAEFLRRKQSNSSYSMRAFALYLQVSPGALSDIFARKRLLTRPLAERIAHRLFAEPAAAEDFLAKFHGTAVRASRNKSTADQELELREATFALMADWLHLAVLSLFETVDFQCEATWIARRFGQPVARIQQVLERLCFLGLINKENGLYILATGPTRTTNDIPSEAVRAVHKAILQRIVNGIDSTDVAHRDVQSMTLAIDPKKLPVAKQLLQSFKKTLSDFLESGERTEVYHFNLQLFPVTEVRT